MTARSRSVFLATIACAAYVIPQIAHADYILNGGENTGTYRIRDNGAIVGYYTPPADAKSMVETYGEDFAVTPDRTTVYQFTNSLGFSDFIFGYDVASRAYLPSKLLHSGFLPPPNGNFILNARMSMIRSVDPLGAGDLFTISGSFPFMSVTPQIKRYNRATDSYVETINPPIPQAIYDFAFGTDNRLYMAAENGIFVYQESVSGFDLVSPTPIVGGLTGKITFGPDGLLYLLNPNSDDVQRYTTAGELVDTFIPSAAIPGGVPAPSDYYSSIQFGADGNIHILLNSGVIGKFDGSTGNQLAVLNFAGPGPTFFLFAAGRATYLPVPEPSSIPIVFVGLAASFTRFRRKSLPQQVTGL